MKKAEFRQAGTGAPVFTYWVKGDAASLADYKAVTEAIKTSNGASRYIPDLAETFNGQPNPNKGLPVFLSFNGPIAEGTMLQFTDNGQGGRNVIAEALDEPPANTSLEREWLRKRDLAEAAEANALAQLRADEVRAQRAKAMAVRNAFGRGNTPVAAPVAPTVEAHINANNPAVGALNTPVGAEKVK